jgi:hypothetical protein
VKYYTVTLEVSETHSLTVEIVEVEAKGEGDAVNIAKKMYLNGSERHHFTICHDDVDDQYVVDATAKEDE